MAPSARRTSQAWRSSASTNSRLGAPRPVELRPRPRFRPRCHALGDLRRSAPRLPRRALARAGVASAGRSLGSSACPGAPRARRRRSHRSLRGVDDRRPQSRRAVDGGRRGRDPGGTSLPGRQRRHLRRSRRRGVDELSSRCRPPAYAGQTRDHSDRTDQAGRGHRLKREVAWYRNDAAENPSGLRSLRRLQYVATVC